MKRKLNKMLSVALCGLPEETIQPTEFIEDDTVAISISGPLSSVYTQALQVAYAKKDPVTGKTSMESQAMDVALAKSEEEAEARRIQEDLHRPLLLNSVMDRSHVYALYSDQVTAETIPLALSEMKENEYKYIAVENRPTCSKDVITLSTEQCKIYGITLVHSVEEFAEQCRLMNAFKKAKKAKEKALKEKIQNAKP
jgi:hypothetical protein